MSTTRTRSVAALIAIACASALSACSDSASGGEDAKDTGGKVTITVEGWRPGDEKATIDTVKKQAADFNKTHPGITVVPKEWQWSAETFSAQLAGNTLPTTFRVPFTDTKGLAERHQIADVTDLVNALPYAKQLNPSVLEAIKGADGKIYGLPSDVYGVGLHYNRTLFQQAGLDPDKPPTTWEQVQSYAHTISQKTKQPGYVQMSKNNTGGWMLTTLTYAQGGRIQTGTGTDVKATLDNPGTQAALELLKTMRWQDNSMGSNTSYDWDSINQAFAAGKVGMYMSGSDVYNALTTTNQIKPEQYGLAVLPMTSNPGAGILGGGSVSAVSAKATPAQRKAAIAWTDFYRIRKMVDQSAAVADAKTLAATKQPIGTPTLPIFDKATWDRTQSWIKPYVNVPLNHMTSFTDGVFKQQLISEPSSKTQETYGVLDSVVQKVLSDKNADIPALLKSANQKATTLLK
ncbi:ABC transporter substrate-binding protein [Luteipulveratus mongoliensis]|uniref:Sugar ABC transporter substrate-binding protein n=1 Tax=Luteipulveratus mongoliensis TaxID=571913 RepID=A0A0K1JGW4_9MICO|nr:extracellular solute-binding protein [Luteipulveratus mongoliensis]AKU15946.1 sugar ABC transporter substrate-binding protein [Luteipulveratus mongoliensis]